jgi:hypothetical protein
VDQRSAAPRRYGKPFRRIWIGAAAAFDLFGVPGATDVCKLNTVGTGPVTPGNPYNCVDPSSGQNFPLNDPTGQTNTSIAPHGDLVQSGFAFGNTRLLVALDYALTPNLLVGARAGYVLGTDPARAPGAAFAPIHVEGRLTYLFGDDAIERTFAPMVLVAAGVGEFDAYVQVPVFLNQQGAANPTQQQENAWITAGPVFVAAGGGMRLLLSDDLAATAALKFETAFGGSAGALFGAAPEVGLQLGF